MAEKIDDDKRTTYLTADDVAFQQAVLAQLHATQKALDQVQATCIFWGAYIRQKYGLKADDKIHFDGRIERVAEGQL